MSASVFYAGQVMHRRLRPKHYRFDYKIFSLLLDLDELNELSSGMRLFSRNRYNLFGFYDRDYGDGSKRPLREQVEAHMMEAGIQPDGGAIRLLTMPRVLGYAFNPISIYYCYLRSGVLAAIIYEVNNTFGERHSYFISTAGASAPYRHKCAKQFYVSPFMDIDLTYMFRLRAPDERVQLSIITSDSSGPLLIAVFSAERHALNDGALLRAFFVYPFLTLKVIAGIYWEALKMWLKGIRPRPRPAAPTQTITYVNSSDR